MRAVRRHVGDPSPSRGKPEQRLDRLADAIVAKGIEGDVAAAREIGDRLDGKPTQELDVHHEGELTLKSVIISQLDSFFIEATPRLEDRSDEDVVPN